MTLVEQLRRSPVTKISSHGYMLNTRLRKAGSKQIYSAKVVGIQDNSVTVLAEEQEQVISPIDQVIIAVGTEPNANLLDVEGYVTLLWRCGGNQANSQATEEGARAAWMFRW